MTTGPGADYIVQMQPWLGEEEKKAVVEYLDSGGWLTEFRRTREFEQALAAYIGAKHVSVVMNGTISLFAALAALGVGAGDEVIVPDLTMIASANAVLLTGATPRFVDVDRATLCLDLAQAERAVTPRTKAIMLVAFNGRATAAWSCWRTRPRRSAPAGVAAISARSAPSAASRSRARR
jgi:perosamine synthetase